MSTDSSSNSTRPPVASIRLKDGNVGAETARGRGHGDVCLWVLTPDAYKHRLYLTTDEFERLLDLGDQLAAQIEEGTKVL